MKIERKRDKSSKVTDGKKEHEINLETGDVNEVKAPPPPVEPWSLKKKEHYDKCVYLIKKIEDGAINIISEQTLQMVAHSLAIFGDPQGRELFNRVCVHQTDFDTESLKELFEKALRTTKFATPARFYSICKDFDIAQLVGDDQYEYYIFEGPRPVFFSDKITEEQVQNIQDYEFMELRNQYWFAERDKENKRISLRPKSKFTIHVLYHIFKGKSNKRVIVLTNNRNVEVLMEIETKEINSLQSFKSLTEGAGYFVLDKSFKDGDLQMIKNKIFAEERASKQLEVLGWNKERFFAFCNGVYHIDKGKFFEVDKYGIVSVDNVNYHIPFHPHSDEYSFINEKKIFYKQTDNVNFENWSKAYYGAFGMIGYTAMVFTVASMFSDFIFSMKNNFPMLFLYGEGGSGKGTVCQFAQHLFGVPQPPLKLTEKANTDKARVRKFATYTNMPMVIEEFSNSIDQAAVKTLTNLYDRFGYERSSMETRYGTETVPVRSTVMITGNEYPSDDPLMQRMIMMDVDKNKHSNKEVENFRALEALNRRGLTIVLTELLHYRDAIETNWLGDYQKEYDLFRKECEGVDVPSRMIENYSVLVATHATLSAAGLKWPLKIIDFKKFLKRLLLNQADRRNTSTIVQRFWNIVLSLASRSMVKENREFFLDGTNLYIRFTEIHALYMEEHARQYRMPGVNLATMKQKLKNSDGFLDYVNSVRFGGTNPTSAYLFDSQKIGIDLAFIVNQGRSFTNQVAGPAPSDGPEPPPDLDTENQTDIDFPPSWGRTPAGE